MTPVRDRGFAFALIGLAAVATAMAGPARAEPNCADAVRTLIKSEYPGKFPLKTPVKSRILTKMPGSPAMATFVLTDGERHLSLNEDGAPVALYTEGGFYTTPDNGESWVLEQAFSATDLNEARRGLETQAQDARNITCTHGLDLDGRTVHHYTAKYTLHMIGMPVHAEYWVLPDTDFAWKTRLIYDPGAENVVVEQTAEPAPEERLPNPEG
ncbi:hypothetical protein [Hoeflea olei]|uniref:Uncharacterized protein n=1 Tax=Hoeflea olei TaxID=1480615 RepID=A0A1C1YZ90_9HYPH|nr:hypothetical protein [Hoeflea olei]OCW58853.1 hypothetical protein AWJ14_20960 [Hoeflea olei]